MDAVQDTWIWFKDLEGNPFKQATKNVEFVADSIEHYNEARRVQRSFFRTTFNIMAKKGQCKKFE